MTRVYKGDPYFFVRILWDARGGATHCETHDWYFDSDDMRFRVGNYFATREAAKACAMQINEKYSDEILRLAKPRTEADRLLRKQLCETINEFIKAAPKE